MYYVYILANKRNGTLYVGITNDLHRRMEEHKSSLVDGFTNKYKIDKLVYYEDYQYVQDAIVREKRLKEWHRKWKLELIEKSNPNWEDLYSKII